MQTAEDTQVVGEGATEERASDFGLAPALRDRHIEQGFSEIDPQLRAFCHEYITNGYNHRAAAEKTGSSPNAGIRIRRDPLVAAYIHYLQAEQHQANIITQDFIQAKLEDLYDMAVGDVEVPLVTGSGMEVTAKKFNGPLALSIVTEISKMNGHTKSAEDTGKTGNGVTINIDMSKMLGSPQPEAIEVISEQ